MLRITCLALLALLATACSERGTEPSFVSEAVAAPMTVPDYGWRTNSPADAEDREVKEYH